MYSYYNYHASLAFTRLFYSTVNHAKQTYSVHSATNRKVQFVLLIQEAKH